MDNAEKERRQLAVAVAKDVIAQVSRTDNPLVVETGSFLSTRQSSEKFLLREYPKLSFDLTPVVEEVQATCHVCAMGAAILSLARVRQTMMLSNENLLLHSDADGGGFEVRLLRRNAQNATLSAFPPRQFDLIEAAFEQTSQYRMTFDKYVEHLIAEDPTVHDRFEDDPSCIDAEYDRYADEMDAAAKWSHSSWLESKGDTPRLVAIMKNVIDNNGVFDPRDKRRLTYGY